VFGFEGSGVFVTDRFHNFSHSEFFEGHKTDEFVKTFWVPFIVEGKKVTSDWDKKRPNPPWRLNFISIFPLRWALLLPLLAVVLVPVTFLSGMISIFSEPHIEQEVTRALSDLDSQQIEIRIKAIKALDRLQAAFYSFVSTILDSRATND
jgi:hypothetical protein